MLRKELFGGNATHDQSDRLNKILSGTEITGDIVSDSNLLIEGEIIGNISCSGKVMIGTSGKIRGNLVCVNAEVDGAMDGELTIENLLVLHSTARIKGDIQTLKLTIEEGAYFEGACVMKSPVSNTSMKSDFDFDE
ncbi:MAG: polymer-forming cytoskeletal protein [Crocinitomicaceae bacterium]|jgi:cytoskeletal protein CcmA (bactofilin family)|nr:polymer-forming cytoskeletal protein [Crocinitomicaceae bacterium]